MNDFEKTQALEPGVRCEFRYPARREWLPGTVVRNGGSSFWKVIDHSDSEGNNGGVVTGLYIEHVRALGTDPWGSP